MRLLPVEYLPDDYKGPNAGTEKEIIGEKTNIVYRYHFASCTHGLHVAWSVFKFALSSRPHRIGPIPRVKTRCITSYHITSVCFA